MVDTCSPFHFEERVKKCRMKIHHLMFPLWMGIIMCSVAACTGKKDKKADEGPKQTEFEQSMDAQDTVAVKALIDKFFTYVKNKQTDEAVLMLYRNDQTEDGTPVELDNEEMAEVRAMLEAIPMKGYEIARMKFSEYYVNEVQCNVVIREAEDGMPPVTTKMYFKPVFYLGNWVLCLTNTEYGDRSLEGE